MRRRRLAQHTRPEQLLKFARSLHPYGQPKDKGSKWPAYLAQPSSEQLLKFARSLHPRLTAGPQPARPAGPPALPNRRPRARTHARTRSRMEGNEGEGTHEGGDAGSDERRYQSISEHGEAGAGRRGRGRGRRPEAVVGVGAGAGAGRRWRGRGRDTRILGPARPTVNVYLPCKYIHAHIR